MNDIFKSTFTALININNENKIIYCSDLGLQILNELYTKVELLEMKILLISKIGTINDIKDQLTEIYLFDSLIKSYSDINNTLGTFNKKYIIIIGDNDYIKPDYIDYFQTKHTIQKISLCPVTFKIKLPNYIVGINDYNISTIISSGKPHGTIPNLALKNVILNNNSHIFSYDDVYNQNDISKYVFSNIIRFEYFYLLEKYSIIEPEDIIKSKKDPYYEKIYSFRFDQVKIFFADEMKKVNIINKTSLNYKEITNKIDFIKYHLSLIEKIDKIISTENLIELSEIENNCFCRNITKHDALEKHPNKELIEKIFKLKPINDYTLNIYDAYTSHPSYFKSKLAEIKKIYKLDQFQKIYIICNDYNINMLSDIIQTNNVIFLSTCDINPTNLVYLGFSQKSTKTFNINVLYNIQKDKIEDEHTEYKEYYFILNEISLLCKEIKKNIMGTKEYYYIKFNIIEKKFVIINSFIRNEFEKIDINRKKQTGNVFLNNLNEKFLEEIHKLAIKNKSIYEEYILIKSEISSRFVKSYYDEDDEEDNEFIRDYLKPDSLELLDTYDEKQSLLDELRRRDEITTDILRNINEINELYNDINVLIGEQGETIDRIDFNMVKAENIIQDGSTELKKAEKSQKQNNKLMKVMLGISLLVGTSLGISLGVKLN
jgi:hypothetical protein